MLLSESSDKSADSHLSEQEPANDGNTAYIKFELGIRDYGCGISEEKLKGLFINFNNLQEHRKNNPTGRGLGLSICKMIVEQMGGTVEVKSKVGQGSTFSIIFKAMCKGPDSADEESKQLVAQ